MKRALLSKHYPFGIGKHPLYKFTAESKASESRSCNLLLQSGLIIPSSSGIYHLMPMMVRSIEKLTQLIDNKMGEINAQKVIMSHIGVKSEWQQTGRWESFGKELVKTNLGGSEFCLCPTHEESICSVMSKFDKQLSHMHCPMRFYQTTQKFRNELRPQNGLLRCREFLMNDLYTFDVDEASSRNTYNEVTNMYAELFKDLNVDVVKVKANTGVIGGDLSHEYHILHGIGQDTVCISEETGEIFNQEYIIDHNTTKKKLTTAQAIEVGHTFLLGTRYSEQLNLRVATHCGAQVPFQMGCYGLGVTRIIAACIETMSTETGMRWPFLVAPYKVCIILPKDGSKEFNTGSEIARKIFNNLSSSSSFNNDVIVDDRGKKTIGWKLDHANLVGYPVVIIVGKHITEKEPKVEIIFQTNEVNSELVSVSNVNECIMNKVSTSLPPK